MFGIYVYFRWGSAKFVGNVDVSHSDMVHPIAHKQHEEHSQIFILFAFWASSIVSIEMTTADGRNMKKDIHERGRM